MLVSANPFDFFLSQGKSYKGRLVSRQLHVFPYRPCHDSKIKSQIKVMLSGYHYILQCDFLFLSQGKAYKR